MEDAGRPGLRGSSDSRCSIWPEQCGLGCQSRLPGGCGRWSDAFVYSLTRPGLALTRFHAYPVRNHKLQHAPQRDKSQSVQVPPDGAFQCCMWVWGVEESRTEDVLNSSGVPSRPTSWVHGIPPPFHAVAWAAKAQQHSLVRSCASLSDSFLPDSSHTYGPTHPHTHPRLIPDSSRLISNKTNQSNAPVLDLCPSLRLPFCSTGAKSLMLR